jgi:ribosome-interacting GTPase 1
MPDFEDPIVLRETKGGYTVLSCMNQIHRDLAKDFKSATVWGRSVKYIPQTVSITHKLEDEDVLLITKSIK